MISSIQNEEMPSGNDENEAELKAGGRAGSSRQSWIFAMHCENFAKIAKISQS